LPTVIENDANTAALAEQHLGAGKGSKVMLFVTISTGIGTGLVLDGKVYHGAHDTEGGHVIVEPGGPLCGCGGRGHFEAVASGRAIERDYGRIARDIHESAIWNDIAAKVAVGLSSLITAYSPDTVVLGGGVGGVHYDRLHRPLLKHLERSHLLYPLPKIRRAKFTETAPLYGCFILARDLVA
jgi:glucokinase